MDGRGFRATEVVVVVVVVAATATAAEAEEAATQRWGHH